jgi:hypothetical protein
MRFGIGLLLLVREVHSFVLPSSCMAGTYHNKTLNTCQNCQIGSYSNQAGTAGCSTCPVGSHTGGWDQQSSCSWCDAGHAWVNVSRQCERITSRSYVSGSLLLRRSEAQECEKQDFAGLNHTICTSCPANYILNLGKTECEACLAPAFRPNSSWGCDCPENYKLAFDQRTCIRCPPGSYRVAGWRSQTCAVCGAGTFVSDDAAGCTPCDAGKGTGLRAGTSIQSCAPVTCPLCEQTNEVQLCNALQPASSSTCSNWKNLLPGGTNWAIGWYHSPHFVQIGKIWGEGRLAISKSGRYFATMVTYEQWQFVVVTPSPKQPNETLSVGSWMGNHSSFATFVWAVKSDLLLAVTKSGSIHLMLPNGQPLYDYKQDYIQLTPVEMASHWDCVALPLDTFVCAATHLASNTSDWWWFRLHTSRIPRSTDGNPETYSYTQQHPAVHPGSLSRLDNEIRFITYDNAHAVKLVDDTTYEVSQEDYTIQSADDTPLLDITRKWISYGADLGHQNPTFKSVDFVPSLQQWNHGNPMHPANPDPITDFDFLPYGTIIALGSSIDPKQSAGGEAYLYEYHHVRPCPVGSTTPTSSSESVTDCMCTGNNYLENSQVCLPCDLGCPTGQYQTAPCNATHNIQCVPCRQACATGQYISQACSTIDIQCTECNEVTCPAGTYPSGICTGSSFHSTIECVPCDSCEPGTFIHSNGTCDGVSTQEVQLECLPCDTVSCSVGTYRTNSCTGATMQDTVTCQACDPCPAGQYYKSGCDSLTFTSEHVCEPCPYCPNGTYIGQYGDDCQGNHAWPSPPKTCVEFACVANAEGIQTIPLPPLDGTHLGEPECAPCNVCASGEIITWNGTQCGCASCVSNCSMGEFQWPGACTGHTMVDDTCRACVSNCVAGEVIRGLDKCDGHQTGNTVECLNCVNDSIACPFRFRLSLALCDGSTEVPNHCVACTLCGNGTFEDVECTDAVDTTCAECDTCQDGQFRKNDCNDYQNTECVDCNEHDDYFLPAGYCRGGPADPNGKYQPCTICGSGELETTPCSKYQDRVCTTRRRRVLSTGNPYTTIDHFYK